MNFLNSYAKVSTLALGLALSLAIHSVNAQATVPLNIDDTPSPLQTAVHQLRLRFHYVITYEESPYVYEGDLHSEMVKGRQSIYPRGGTLSLPIPASPSISTQTMAALLNQLMQVQANRGEGGHFRVLQAGDVFHVVPTEVRDKNGDWVAQTPLLDTPISLPEANYRRDAMIDAICKALSLAAHVQVTQDFGLSRISNDEPPPSFHFGAHNERARDVLMRALTLIDNSDPLNKMTYVLWYGTGIIDGLTDCSKPDCGRFYSLRVGSAY